MKKQDELSLRLNALNGKRLAFIEREKQAGRQPAGMLYIQHMGGFAGIGLNGQGRAVWVSGPGPMEDADYLSGYADNIRFEDCCIEPEGFGGVFGFGKKGGSGWRIIWSSGESELSAELIPGLTAIADVSSGQDMVFSEHNRKGYNPVWDFRIMDREKCEMLVNAWKEKLAPWMSV